MTFTAELGTEDSMPGNLALGFSQSEGGGTGGLGPGAMAGNTSMPDAVANVSLPAATSTTHTPTARADASIPTRR